MLNTINGTSGADSLTGTEGDDLIIGQAGNDTLIGNAGNDLLIDGNGASTTITVNAAASLAGPKLPLLLVFVNGTQVQSFTVDNSLAAGPKAYTFTLAIPPELVDSVTVGFDNDYATNTEDQNLFIYSVKVGNQTTNVPDEMAYAVPPGTSGAPTILYATVSNATFGFSPQSSGALTPPVTIDRMVGGLGDDTYYVDSASDVVVEEPDFDADFVYQNGGNDKIISTISLTAADYVENLSLVDGSAAIRATGNGRDNKLIGNSNNNLLEGLDGNDYLDGGAGTDTMVGGAGDDTFVIDNMLDSVQEGVDAGTDTVNTKIDYTLQANFENLNLLGTAVNGTGNAAANVIVGNGIANHLYGLAGNDTLTGAGGADTLEGGADNDTYFVDDGGTTIIEGVGQGIDKVYIANIQNYTLADNLENAEISASVDQYSGQLNASYTLTGNAANNQLIGSFNNDSISGLDGNDLIDGSFGIDTLTGGIGNDTLMGGSGNDQVFGGADQDSISGDAGDDQLSGEDGNDFIDGGEGSDNVSGALGNDSLYGGDNNDTLSGADGDDLLDGGDGDDLISGGIGNDVIYAGAGDDNLNAGVGTNIVEGGAGDDFFSNAGANATTANTWRGGSGSDTYFLQSTLGTTVIEEDLSDTTSIDLVATFSNHTLTAGVENLTLLGSATAGTGNALNNYIASGSRLATTLSGLAGNDTLEGNGINSDTLIGGLGDDTYILHAPAQVVLENAGEGNDTVVTSYGNYVDAVSGKAYYQIQNAALENITLAEDTTAPNALGNASANMLTGNAAANVLDGQAGNDTLIGGDGDTLIGGTGNDTYVIAATPGTDSTTAVIQEQANAGLDTVVLTDIHVYTMGADIENVITDVSQDSTLTLTRVDGNALNNFIIGGAVENLIDGAGGNDTIWGGNTGDRLSGGIGDDRLAGGEGDDALDGGTGNDSLVGGNGNDRLSDTGGGNDTLEGGAGDDQLFVTPVAAGNTVTLRGGAGNDSYYIGGGVGTLVIEEDLSDTTSIDSVSTSVDYTLGAGLEVLYASLGASIKGTGNSLNNILTDGYSKASSLYGLAGNDTLRGYNVQDTLVGGADNDTYELFDTITGIVEGATEGIDTILAHVNNYTDATSGNEYYRLGTANVENVTLADEPEYGILNAMGDNGANRLQGNSGFNVLDGQGGNDTLTGDNGDILIGGAGDDTYVITAAPGDYSNTATISEQANGGTDTALLTDIHVYTMGANLENVVTGVSDGSGLNFNRVDGNALNNLITAGTVETLIDGAAGNDTINGGTARDRIIGGLGDDRLFGGEGDDDLDGGVGNDSLVGGNGRDRLSDSGGNDTLEAGAGDDTLFIGTVVAGNTVIARGGSGSDTYFVNGGAGTLTIEEDLSDTTSIDTVITSKNYTMDAGIENLGVGINASVVATGNSLNNLMSDGYTNGSALYGMAGNDTLQATNEQDTLVGGADNDTYELSADVTNIQEGAAEGYDTILTHITNFTDVATGKDYYKLNALNIENLTLADDGEWSVLNAMGDGNNNQLFGNAYANILDGQDGQDTLTGGDADTLIGGAGNDTFIVTSSTVVVSEAANGGIDEVDADVSFTLGNNIENLTLNTGKVDAVTATGNALNNTLVGNELDNVLSGGAGNDTIGGFAGADTLVGGTGDDLYVLHDTLDTIVEGANEGHDSVATIGLDAVTLANEVEDFIGTFNGRAVNATGNGLANYMQGSGFNDTLNGGAGDDSLTGGSGSDLLNGGAGNDTYYLDVAGDTITGEAATVGEWDKVYVNFNNYTLGTNLEEVVLNDLAGVLAATGNSGNNLMTGNSLANTLNGGAGNDTLVGGAGNDTLTGGTGNDTYYIDSGDVLSAESTTTTEIDSVYANYNYTLLTNFENLTLIEGSAATTATGNTLNNALTGNSLNNSLSGGTGNDTLNGGAGNDTLNGGTGNDTYYIDSGDTITGEGTTSTEIDTVNANFSYTLGANLENLNLIEGSAATNGTGNTLANTINGNSAGNNLGGGSGNDKLYGLDGNDTIDGGSGNDTVEGGAGNDTIIDSVSSGDTYGWGRSLGADTLADVGGTDVLNITGATAQQIWFTRTGTDVTLTVLGTTDTFKISKFYAGATTTILGSGATETLNLVNGNTGDKTLTASKVNALVTAMASFSATPPTTSTLPSNAPTTLVNAIASNWV